MFAAIKIGSQGRQILFISARARNKAADWRTEHPPVTRRLTRFGPPWPKKIQDEKTRANAKMKTYSDPMFAEALNLHLREEFDTIIKQINSRNSQNASKTSAV